jgi:hypothetical protein
LAELESNLRKAVEGPTAFPVVEPDPGTTFSDVWPAIALGARLGFYRQGLATCGHTNVFFVPSREDEKLSPMVLAGFNGNTPPDGVDIARVHDGALALGSTNLPLAELRRHFRAKADKSQCVIVMPADHAPMSRAGEVLNAIVGTGNSNVCLVREVTVTQPTDQACREWLRHTLKAIQEHCLSAGLPKTDANQFGFDFVSREEFSSHTSEKW